MNQTKSDHQKERTQENLRNAANIVSWIQKFHPGAEAEIKVSIEAPFFNEVVKMIFKKQEFSRDEQITMEMDIQKLFNPSLDLKLCFE